MTVPHPEPDAARERRLEALREDAAREGRVRVPGVRPGGGPIPAGGMLPGADATSGYYGLPLLKAPVWTWEVPVYFFVGGAAGGAALIAAAARWVARDPALERDARLIAVAGGAVSPILLISDLGRPARFLNMLRVFKPQSPMSVGAWTLVAFSSATAKAALASALAGQERRHPLLRFAARTTLLPADAAAVVTGLILSSYTGALIGVTAVPVWARNVRVLPFHFGVSGLGTASALLELRHDHPGLRRLGAGIAAAEMLISGAIELRRGQPFAPLHHGASGRLTRIAGLLSGPVPLVLRTFGCRSRPLRAAAAVSLIAGSALARFAWMEAGRRSAEDSREALQLDSR